MFVFSICIEHAILYHLPKKPAFVVYDSSVGIAWHSFLEFLDRKRLSPSYGILQRVNVSGGSGLRLSNQEDAFCSAYNCGFFTAEQFCRSQKECEVPIRRPFNKTNKRDATSCRCDPKSWQGLYGVT